jgi:lysophospholipase L1-like esterase
MVRFRIASFRIPLVALALTAAAVCVSSRLSDAGAASARFAAPHSLTIVAFGSSSTQGVGASSPAAAYPAQLRTMLRAALPDTTRVDVVNRGIGGEDIDDMMVRLDRDVIAGRPSIVVWQIGSNDALRHVPLARFEQKTRAGIAALRKAGIAIVLMEPQWCPALDRTGTADGFRDAVRRIGAETRVPVIRRSDLMHDWIRSGLLTMTDMLSPDGLHMRDAGYRMLAGWVAAEVLHMDAEANAPHERIRTAGL